MDLKQLIAPERVTIGLKARDKAQLLSFLAEQAGASVGLPPAPILAALQAREALGSTGVGQGIALPHARIDGLARTYGALARLERPIEYAAIDEGAVDLVVLLLSPATGGQEHLSALSAISRRMRDRGVAQRLRQAGDAAQAYAVLTGGP